MASMTSLVHYQFKDGVAHISMDDGKANVMSLAMQAEFNSAFDRAQQDNAVVLLSGREGKFSAGFDLAVLATGGTDAAKMLLGGFTTAQRLLMHPRPVVVACTGHAMAMGLFLALCGDYCIGVDGNYKMSANEVAIGITLPRTAIEICRNRLAPAHLIRATLTSEVYSPAQAVDAGMLDELVAQDELLERALAKAIEFTALNNEAYIASKKLLRSQLTQTIAETIQADEKTFNDMFCAN
ncbi:MAG: crotonase/enoyl-CoA hydratase family protein [Pseudomonadales bacterium]|nr:crotonase/enoyl-CoA hydratase family protein [Pseudomonadales bacterium]